MSKLNVYKIVELFYLKRREGVVHTEKDAMRWGFP